MLARPRTALTPLRLAALAAALVAAPPAGAADFEVEPGPDTADALPGDGRCEDADGRCSLRAALEEADALLGPDRLLLLAGLHELDAEAVAASELTLVPVDRDGERPQVRGPLRLDGSVRIEGLELDDLTLGGPAELAGLLVRRGRCLTVPPGARVRAEDTEIRECTDSRGTAILVHGELALEGCRIVENRTVLVDGQPGVLGCGLRASPGSRVSLLNCLVQDNGGDAISGEMGVWPEHAAGGGLAATGSEVVLEGCSFVGNRAGAGTGYSHQGGGTGGAVHVRGGSLRVAASTFAENSILHTYDASALTAVGAEVSLRDCSFVANEGANPFYGDATVDFRLPLAGATVDNTLYTTAAQGGELDAWTRWIDEDELVRLAGPGWVAYQPLPDSEAVDGGGGCLVTDQLGVLRPPDDCDLGAVEQPCSDDDDADGDGIGDACDPCPLPSAGHQTDPDEDGRFGPCDPCPELHSALDTDGDCVPYWEDPCPATHADDDTDGDCLHDAQDPCPLDPGPASPAGLRVRLDASERVLLSWEPGYRSEDQVATGPLDGMSSRGDPYEHARLDCAVAGGSLATEVEGNAWFLVRLSCRSGTGGAGSDGLGAPRPPVPDCP